MPGLMGFERVDPEKERMLVAAVIDELNGAAYALGEREILFRLAVLHVPEPLAQPERYIAWIVRIPLGLEFRLGA